MAMADPFLSESEKKQIQGNYETILNYMKHEELSPSLFQGGHLSEVEKSNFKKKTDNEIRQYIIDEVFLKSTYEQNRKIYDILMNSNIPGHMEIAKLLPNRRSKEVFKPPEAMGQNQGNKPHFPTLERRTSEPNTMTLPVQEVQIKRHSAHLDDYNSAGSDQEGISSNDYYYGAGDPGLHPSPSSPGLFKKGMSKIRHSFLKKKTWKSSPDVSKEPPPPLSHYGVKENNHPVCGNGLCVIIANFTEDLQGYEKDTVDIVDFHRNVLKWNYVFSGDLNGLSLKNLSNSQFMNVLVQIQAFLKNPISGNMIDRFFLYILSHGDEDGIMTCKEGSAIDPEETDKDGKPMRIKMQDIVDVFTHDQVSNLKTFPKVIINQTCQGTELLKAAGVGGHDSVDTSIKIKEWKPPIQKLAIGADVLVCDATSRDSMSWVADRGSLFIQNLIEVMREYYWTEHLYDMLVEVNDRVGHKVKRGVNPTDNKIVPASQMPKIHSQLTKKFYLARPHQKGEYF